MRHHIAMPLALLACFLPGVSRGQVESTFTFLEEACFKAEVAAIAGVDASACIIMDAKEESAAVELKLCGGFYFDEKLKLFGIGEAGGLEWKSCAKFELKTRTKSKAEALKLLEDKGAKGVALRDSLLQDMKRRLRQQPDETLARIGITREQINKAESLRFRKIQDATDKFKQLQKIFEKCPTITPKDVS